MDRTQELRRLQDFYEKERDKLYDQVANLQGQKERLDWAIRVVNTQIHQIEKQEQERILAEKRQREAFEIAKEKGNVGSHPSERKQKLNERRKQAKQIDDNQVDYQNDD